MTEFWIADPKVALFGCQAWPPRPDPLRECPVCDRGINASDPTYYCAVCDSLAPQVEARVRAARLGLEAKDRRERADRKARDRLGKLSGTVLSEVDRRRLWNGSKATVLAELQGELTNLAKEGRDFLARIGQTPDWTRVLKKRGQVDDA